MEKCKATAKIWLDSRKPLKTGKYSVKMEIYYARKTMRYDTGITVTKDEWEKMNGQNLRIPQLQKDLKTLNLLKSKAHDEVSSCQGSTLPLSYNSKILYVKTLELFSSASLFFAEISPNIIVHWSFGISKKRDANVGEINEKSNKIQLKYTTEVYTLICSRCGGNKKTPHEVGDIRS